MMDESGGSESDHRQSSSPELRLRHQAALDEDEQVLDDDEKEQEQISDSEASETCEPAESVPSSKEEDIAIPRAPPRNLQPQRAPPRNLQHLPPQPSFLTRQIRTVKNFFIELIEFILLFLTTLFNPMADVNTQVQEHNQRRMAREGRGFSSSCKPSSSFPGCGPSS